ncbi:MAG: hypothetical protein ABEJ89_03195 [Haloarculaceae archaeon]
MSSGSDAGELASEMGDLVRALEDLQAELEPEPPGRLVRPPTPRELARFTSEVGIPAVVLLLRTNIRALKLLQRALRLADDRPSVDETPSEVRERAARASRATLSRLDDALADLQGALEGRPPGDEARELLAEARELRATVEDRLEAAPDADETTDVPVDVDAELESLKAEMDDGDEGDGTTSGDGDGDVPGDGASGSGDATDAPGTADSE